MEELKPFNINLKGSGERQHLFGREPKTAGLRSGKVILRPGEEIGEHNTDDKEEAIIIFEGTAEILSEKSPAFIAEKDTISYIPAKTKHNVRNIGKSVLKYIYIVK